MTVWFVVLAIGAGSYAMRVLPLVANPAWLRSPHTERTLGYAGTAAIAALTAAALHDGAHTAGVGVAIVAAAAALVVALRGGSMLRVIVAGGLAQALAVGMITLLG